MANQPALPAPTAITADQFTYEGQPKALPVSEIEQVREALTTIRANFSNPEMVGQMLKFTLGILKKTPVLTKLLAPEDGETMTRALRLSYGKAVQIKEVRKTKRTESKAAQDNILGLLAANGLNLNG